MEKMFRVEFNTSGFYFGQGIFEALDETSEVKAENATEAIELVIDYFIESDPDRLEIDVDKLREKYEAYSYVAYEIVDGQYDHNQPLYRD